MIHLSTVLIQWAAGGLFFGWITTRRNLLSAGYGWLIRGVYGGIAGISILTSFFQDFEPVREISTIVLIAAALAGIWTSIIKKAKLSAQLDLLAALAGFVGVVGGAFVSDGTLWLQIFRFIIGALFIGALTDTMLLGHWYLVQPGLSRRPLKELLKWAGILCLFELLVWLLPTGMVSVLNGSIDDGQGGLFGWFWVVATISTIALVWTGDRALKEKGYQAVMATTGLAYLSLLTGFVEDIMARLALRLI